MAEICSGFFDYTVQNADIDHDVHSTFVSGTDLPFLTDLLKSANVGAWFLGREPKHIYRTNRLHDLGIPWSVESLGRIVRFQEAGFSTKAGIEGVL